MDMASLFHESADVSTTARVIFPGGNQFIECPSALDTADWLKVKLCDL